MLYELGPCKAGQEGDKLTVHENEGSWGEHAGLLFVDQPYGTGYSIAEHPELIPADVEVGSTTHLYTFLHNFFLEHPELSSRPFVVFGESYAGKFVPALAHFILRAYMLLEGGSKAASSQTLKPPPPGTPPPNFSLAGIMVGNGLTDPLTQETVRAEVAHSMGLIDERKRAEIEAMQDRLVGCIQREDWLAAHKARSEILSALEEATGLATLLDVRRDEEYDATHTVDRLLSQASVRQLLNAKGSGEFVRCNPRVREAMAADQMRSVAHLVPDILEVVPCLFYQGQFDLRDGPRGNERWLLRLDWSGWQGFLDAERAPWRVDGRVGGYTRSYGNLHHVVVRNGGHEAPCDRPLEMRAFVNQWIREHVLHGRAAHMEGECKAH